MLSQEISVPSGSPTFLPASFFFTVKLFGAFSGCPVRHGHASLGGLSPFVPFCRICPQAGEDAVFSPTSLGVCVSPCMCFVAFDVLQACVQYSDLPWVMMTMIKTVWVNTYWGGLGPSFKCCLFIFSFLGWTRLGDFTFTFQFHALEKQMATHSSVLAWRIPGTAEPGGPLSMRSHTVGYDWSDLAAAAATFLLLWLCGYHIFQFLFFPW